LIGGERVAETVRGINVVIGADTTKLSKALSDVNQKSKDIQSELRQVERLLKFDPGNTELLTQKQQLLSQAVANTSEKLERLKSVQQQVADQFAKGEISEGQYRAFQREIAKTQQELQRFQERLQETEQEQQKIAGSTKQLQTLFEATGTSVDQFADVLGTKLTNAIKNGTASSQQLDEAITKIGQAALGTNIDLDKLKAALSSVDDGNSIANVKKELNNLSKEADGAKKSISDLGVELENIAGTLVAGGGIAGAIAKALDTSTLNTKIDITFEIPESSKAAVKDAIRSIEAYGVDAEAALEGVRRQWALNRDASDEANATIVKGAAAIASSYSGIDFTELIQEINEISRELNITNEEALGLTNALLKIGFPPEQLDIIAEYGQQLQRTGYSAQEIQALFAAGIETGTWNIDNLLDGLKEGRIRVAEFGQEVPKVIKELLDGTGISAKQMREWGKAVAAGGEQGSKAMHEIALALNNIDDETKKNALGVAIFGTMYEDQGQNIIDTLLNAKNATVDFRANQELLNDMVSKMDASPTVQLQQAFTDLKTASEPLLTVIADVVSAIAEWVSNNPTLAATITAIASAIGILVGAAMALAPIFSLISTTAGALGLSFGAVAGPVGIVVAAIAGLIAIGVLLYKNWDEIKAKAIEIWGAIKGWFSTTLENIKQFFSNTWTSIKEFTSTTWENIKQTAISIWNSIKEGVIAIITPFINGITNIFNGMKDGLQKIFEGLKQYFSGVWELIKNIFLGTVLLIVDLVTGDFEGLKNDAKAIFENMKNALWNIWEGIKKVFSGAVEAVKGFVSAAWENIKSNTSIVFDVVKSTISSIWEGIKSFFSTTVENIKTTISNGFENMKNAVFEKMTAAKQTITDIWNSAQQFLSSINLYEIGRNIIQGLISGISSMASALWEKAKAIADMVKNTIRDALDINSPSRVMRDEVGKWIPIGLAEGISKNIDAVVSATNRMAKATIPTVAGGSFGLTTPAATTINVPKMSGAKIENHFHFHSTAPTPSEVARRNLQVSRQLAMELGW
jgi:phage-related minor tail protein